MYMKNNIFEVETLPTWQLAPWGEGQWGWRKREECQGGGGNGHFTNAPTPLAFLPFPPGGHNLIGHDCYGLTFLLKT